MPPCSLTTMLGTKAQTRLHNSTHLLTISLSPTPLPAPSSYLGLRHPPSPTFSEILRSRWNLALGRAVGGVRETDWAGVGMAVWSEGRGLASKLGGQAEKVVEKVQEVRREEAGYVVGEKYTGGSEGVVKTERDLKRRVEGRLV